MSAVRPDALRGPWPDVRELCRVELDAYLADASDAAIQKLATRCPPWTVHDITRHLAATAARFNAMLAQSRGGDLTPPFSPPELSEENLRAVREFTGDPIASLRREAEGFLADAADPNEVMAHQFDPIPAGLQQLFLLSDITIHHDDVAAAAAGSYQPPELVVDALARMGLVFGREPAGPDRWAEVLAFSGR